MRHSISESHTQNMDIYDKYDNITSLTIKTDLPEDDEQPIGIKIANHDMAFISEEFAKQLISGLRRSLRLRKYGIR